MKRVFSPATNPAGLTSLIAALYALACGIWNVAHHRGAVDPQVIVAALSAVAALFTRQVVTPVTDPKDGAGRRLMPAQPTATGQQVTEIARTFTGQPDYLTGVETYPPATAAPGRPPSTAPRERAVQ